MFTIIDTNNNVTWRTSQIKRDGVETVIRYISTNTAGDKTVKPDEARAIAAAGLKLALVFEVWGGAGNFTHQDINAQNGTRHGEFARSWAHNVGAPDGTIIWFAIDTDVVGTQYNNYVRPYLIAAKAALGGQFRIGLYACGFALASALDQGLIDAAWLTQSMGWNGSRAFRATNRWRLLQGAESTLHGLSIDTNTANGDDYGAFVPFSGALPPVAPPVKPVHDAFWLQARLNELGADPELTVDGDIGPVTIKAIERYLPV